MGNKDSKRMVLKGIVVRGLGEGTFFMSMQRYQKEVKKRLGLNAYTGTLNLKVGKKQADLLRNIPPIKIDGWKSGSKTFGGVNCYKAKIKNIDGSIIMPDLTKHKDIIEFIAPVHLKSELRLKEGDKVEIKLIQ